MLTQITFEFDIPDGFRFKRFGRANKGEWIMGPKNPEMWPWLSPSSLCVILEKNPTYRDVTDGDRFKTIEVTSQQGEFANWVDRKYIGSTSDGRFVVENSSLVVECYHRARVKVD